MRIGNTFARAGRGLLFAAAGIAGCSTAALATGCDLRIAIDRDDDDGFDFDDIWDEIVDEIGDALED